MTNFGQLFKQMWSQKWKYLYLIFLINLFAVVFISVFALITKNYNLFFFYSADHDLGHFWESNFINLTLLFDLAFCATMCWQNEKINTSQTWHLIPVDDRKIYLANITSSLITCGVFFFLQQVVNSILLIPTQGMQSLAYVFQGFGLYPRTFPGIINSSQTSFIFYWFFIVLIILSIYFFVSLINFVSKIISDELPFKSTLWIRLLIIAILVIAGVYLASIILPHLENFIDAKQRTLQIYDPVWLDDIFLVGINIVVGLLDLWLVKKWIEPKIVNR